MTATHTRESAPEVSPPRPGLGRLTEVELRKMTDTRSGRWLLGIAVLLMTATAVVVVYAAKPQHRSLADLVNITPVAAHLLLPVLGVLAVTAEWSHRTALTTFGLVPDRRRVVTAKVLAGLVLAVAALATSSLLACAARLLAAAAGRGAGGPELPEADMLESLVGLGIGATTGTAVGMLVMNAPLAIVLLFLVPVGVGAIVEVLPALEPVGRWTDASVALHELIASGVDAERLGRFAVAITIWLVLPMAGGLIRLSRKEIA